jgi:hypothetical protein
MPLGQPDGAPGVVAVLVGEGNAAEAAEIHSGELGPAEELPGAEAGVHQQDRSFGLQREGVAAGAGS